ncbi:LPXTG cell wall anchor domain-containing protein [Streptococcus anginosus]|uniref:SspB-related isopeptide-forming adhesin n=6 Tax=Streptococcus anginosus TaxID=1328 RepID=UPI001245E02C|nr:SspB-related isopeptide-forming adhesin [Streptococcus anginosus]KAA9311674.1 LPXTG cell wall anchor domain-containing protein [Streptococcus anginosus]MDB8647970.1 GbpC/Spa domain-containing protein [Streptococcus anginosus]MED5922483.1 SspB-related isopeptide-forming adhesin [Streptococcus anginosus]MED5940980.1 SspB-related isopeptide-forming adhesin [Streptococcus anginosus]MED5942730.1 SspB-related isopeptide-forming adhesin [Streptococcus anginosus]
MKSNELKTYGSIRKIKAYGTCGVILGLAALAVATTNGVQADEVAKTEPTTVAPANTATNLPDSQPAKTAEQQNQLNQAGRAQGNVTVQVDNSQVNQAAQAAKKEGVEVVQDAPVDKGTTNTLAETQKAQAEIAADQAKQKAAVEKTTEDYVKAKADHAKAVEATKKQNDQIVADNKALKEAHDKAEKAGQDVNQAVSTAKDKVKAEFKDAKVSESTKAIKVEATKDSYDAYTKEVEKVKADNQKSTDTYIAEKRQEDKDIADTKAYNEGVRKRNAEGKAKVEAENAAIDDFNRNVAEHNKAEGARFAKEKAEAEKNRVKDGYLSEVVSQGLVFKNEADAHIDVKGADSYISAKGLHEAFKDITKSMGLGEDQLQQYVTYFSLPDAKDLKLSKDPSRLTSKFELYKAKAGFVYGGEGNQFGAVNSKVGKTVTVTYTNLKNSSYKGRAISKMELDVTVKPTSENIQDDVVFGFSKNPAKGIEVAARYKDTNKDYKLDLSLRTRFYDADGNLINFEDNKDNPNEAKGLLSLSSLNAYKNHVETARPSDTARFIQISGSSIVKHDNGLVYSNEKDNSNGNHFGLNQYNIIDSTTSPYYWYLAGALALKGTNPEYGITVTSWDKLGDRKGEGRFTPSIWFTVTSELAATGVPTRPQYKKPKERKNFTPEKLKEAPTPKAKLNLVTVNGVPAPTYKPNEKMPTPPVVPTVHYHRYQLKAQFKVEKHNYNAKGELIDDKEMLPEGINYYVSKWSNWQNKGNQSSKDVVKRGFAYIEDYDETKVTGLESRFQVKDAEGKAVNGLKMYHVLDRKTLSKALNDMIDRSGISPKGAFYMWVAEKPEEFYKAYVQTGMDLFFHTPMQNKKGFTGKYTNQTFQVQFGNGYYSNVVVNHVPELKVQKRVYNKLGNGQNLDGKLIKLGDKFYYYLDGAKLPANRGEVLKEYRFFDDFDQKGDEFTGEYKALAGVDIKLKDGSVIKVGTNLSQYAELKYDKAKGIVEISMKQDFLDKVDNASEFDVDAAIQMKRIATGTFENTYKNVVNGHEIVSNTVKTTTPEPEKPQPKTPAPTAQKPALPQTGTASGIGLSVLGMILAGFGLFGLKKHKEN